MPRLMWLFVLVVAGLTQAGCRRVPESDPNRSSFPDSADASVYTWTIETDQSRVQRLFDRGMSHAYGHEWDGAGRLLRKAVRLDSSCALCYWGLAHSVRAVDGQTSFEVLRLLAQAEERASTESARVWALIAASKALPVRLVHVQWADDPDVAVLYAEAMLREAGWKAWYPDGTPGPTTVETLRVLEQVLDRHPVHPGAQHLYLHIMEGSLPELALGVAEKLVSHPSPVRHLRYLPAHIFLRVGRYHDASLVLSDALDINPDATQACAFMKASRHEWHYGEMLWSALVFEGRGADAREAARRLARYAAYDSLANPGDPRRQYLRSLPLITLARFGDWERVVRLPEPAHGRQIETSIWQFVQGVAAARVGTRERLMASMEHVKAALADSAAKQWLPALPFMEAVLVGELAARNGLVEEAIGHFNRAVTLQDSLERGAPSSFYRPARHMLGDVLLAANRPEEAERVFQEDLAFQPENGWALWGLYRSLLDQEEATAARIILDRFNRAWEWADVSM
jgi:tetratricopeptide (TPR) repeat protein